MDGEKDSIKYLEKIEDEFKSNDYALDEKDLECDLCGIRFKELNEKYHHLIGKSHLQRLKGDDVEKKSKESSSETNRSVDQSTHKNNFPEQNAQNNASLHPTEPSQNTNLVSTNFSSYLGLTEGVSPQCSYTAPFCPNYNSPVFPTPNPPLNTFVPPVYGVPRQFQVQNPLQPIYGAQIITPPFNFFAEKQPALERQKTPKKKKKKKKRPFGNKAKEPIAKSQSVVFCEACKRSFTQPMQYIEHVKGKKHIKKQKNFDALKILEKEKNEYSCYSLNGETDSFFKNNDAF